LVSRKILLPLLSVVLTGLACGPVGLPGATPPVAPEAIATLVAATLTALAPPTAGDTPSPPPLPSPSETEEPAATAPPVLRVAYTSAGEAWLLEGAGPPVQITHTGGVQSVVISADGLRIAYLRRGTPEGPAELRAVNRDGSGDLALLTPAQTNTLHPLDGFLRIEPSNFSFIPGSHVLFVNTRAVAEGPGLLKFNDLYQLDADTALLTPVFPAEEGGDFSVSPDGSQLAIVRPSSISMANTDGSGLRPDLVVFDPVLTYSEYEYYPLVVWMADSSSAGVVIPSREPLGADPTASAWRIPAHSGSAVRLVTIPGEFFFFGMGPHSLLAPDLTRLAFARETTTPDIYQLILANTDGSGETVFDTGRFFWQGWSPDASRFLYGSDLPGSLQLGQVGGGASWAGEGTDVRWLNASEYVFLAGHSGAWELKKGVVGGAISTLVMSTSDFFSYDYSW